MNLLMRIFLLLAAGFIVSPSNSLAADNCPRTVSAGGALTEIIYRLAKQECLVGVDTTSTYPPAAQTLPQVGYARQLSAEGILSLTPDVVLHGPDAGPPATLEQIDSAGIRRIIIDGPLTLPGVYDKIETIAALYNVPDRGAALIEKLKEDEGKLTKALHDAPRVLFLMQHGGGAPIAGGKDTAADAIIRLAGGKNVIDFKNYKPLTPEAMAALRPDIIVTTTESLAQMGGEDGLVHRPGIALTPAGANRNIVSMDALYLLGFGPRAVKAAGELATAFEEAE
jgi:iron complex transport system substrate-binding protein